MNEKITWQGTLLAVQPRIRLMRSFDQRSHSYLGYVLRFQGTMDLRQQDRERRHRMSRETADQRRFVTQWLARETEA